MADRSACEYRDIGRAGADIHQGHAQVALVGGQCGMAGSTRVQNQLIDLQTATAHALDNVFGRALSAGHDMHLDLQPAAAHADGFLDLVAVDDKFLRLDQQQSLIVGNIDGLGGLDDPGHINGRDLLVPHDDHAGRVLPPDMAAGDPGVDPGNLAVGHHFGLFERLLDGLDGGVNIDDHAALEPMRCRDAQAGDTQFAIRQYFSHDRHDFGGPDIQPDDQILVFLGHVRPQRFRFTGLPGDWVVTPRSRTA
mmetsp:Transcript_46803/g.110112  ORF Transcript_46803/g.110112 Transcript_46803/m.110112 type:complete len:251 (+) Transcript_46803:1966-2718(+)